MRDILLFVIVVGLVPVILMRPWIGILAWFWSGLMTPHFLTWGFMRTFPIAIVFGGATLAGLMMTKDRRGMPFTREMMMMWMLVAYTAMTSYFAVYPSAWSFWQHLMKILLITFITPILVHGQRRIIALLLVITFSIAFYGFKGGLFAISTGGAHMVLGAKGSYLSGNTYIGIAMIMVLPLVLVSARLFHYQWEDFGSELVRRFSTKIGLILYGVFWLTAIAILATYSRGALLGLLAIAPFLFIRMKRKGLMIALAFLGITVLGVTVPDRLMARWGTIETYEEDTSAMQRVQAWGVSWNMALERPIRGMGFRFTYMDYDWWITYANFEGTWEHVLSPHSIYFSLLGQHGFGGLVVFMTLVGFTFLTLNRIRRHAVRETGQIWLSEYAWAMQMGLIGYLVAGTFLDVAYFSLFYAFVALAIIMRRELEEAPRANETIQADKHSVNEPAQKPESATGPRFPDFVPKPDDLLNQPRPWFKNQ
ncbi:putative O-glycosylation ligase, exosortase A system-associated [Halochromatium salexigens]|uniref:O-glycosylation ligase, exosortase A system-associated n=1 Tax=Halochromatium salexigens TaxID=49447 RepID=A0AAJ0UFM7_HALSE|nr:putative O-glycosylation ligase, exosortase A system-associated [Halochromatium salexigens]MBK5930581.1 putative O-glycosylation ligase, exosortase A system-associated [Halochromatium salexigens]